MAGPRSGLSSACKLISNHLLVFYASGLNPKKCSVALFFLFLLSVLFFSVFPSFEKKIAGGAAVTAAASQQASRRFDSTP